MIDIVSGICIVICIAAIVWGLRILNESRKIVSKKKGVENDDETQF